MLVSERQLCWFLNVKTVHTRVSDALSQINVEDSFWDRKNVDAFSEHKAHHKRMLECIEKLEKHELKNVTEPGAQPGFF